MALVSFLARPKPRKRLLRFATQAIVSRDPGRFPFSAVNGTRFVGPSHWKFPEKVENLKRLARFPGWNFRTECRVPFTFLVVCTSSRSTVGHPATYRGLRPNGTTFYQSEIPLLLPPKFPGFFPKGLVRN